MPHARPTDLRRASLATLAVGAMLLTACESQSDADAPSAVGDSSPSASTSGAPAPVRLVSNLERPRQVGVDQTVKLHAEHGRLREVSVTSPQGPLEGRLKDGTWTSTTRLEPGTTYRVKTRAVRADDGAARTVATSFHTQDLTLDQQTYASVAPLSGETVGVGMPVIVTFDVPVTDKATFEKHMTVTSSPSQSGSWYWLSDTEAHWRPDSYWQAGTDVSVDVDVNSLPAGAGVWGQESRHVDFHVGDSVISKVNAQTHQMQTFINGTLAKTTPITTGKAGFTTRSGVKVIIEKFDSKRMRSETIGIADRGSEDFYDLDDVKWAMRVTYSGEFLHAAPWSVSSQGNANVSHGCTGMSTADAKWLFDRTKRGDVVEYSGTDRGMTLTNGYGDWNLSAGEYAEGSALH